MRFSLSFSMDGAAFDGGDNSIDEVVRILHQLAHRIDGGGVFEDSQGVVRDVNGNTIGSWGVDEDDAPDYSHRYNATCAKCGLGGCEGDR